MNEERSMFDPFIGDSATQAGSSGWVPAPPSGSGTASPKWVLCADGEWHAPSGGGGGSPGSPNLSLQGNNSGAFAGVPGSSIDFTNGTVTIAPPGTTASGAALIITADSVGNFALRLFTNANPAKFGLFFEDDGQGGFTMVIEDSGGALSTYGAGGLSINGQFAVQTGQITLSTDVYDINGMPGTAGQFLKSLGGSGAGVEWADASAAAAGSSGDIQFNNSGALAGGSGTATLTAAGNFALAPSSGNALTITGASDGTITVNNTAITLFDGSDLGANLQPGEFIVGSEVSGNTVHLQITACEFSGPTVSINTGTSGGVGLTITGSSAGDLADMLDIYDLDDHLVFNVNQSRGTQWGDESHATGNVMYGSLQVSNAIGFWGATPLGSKPAVSGSKAGNAALASLITQLVAYGLLTDSTS